MKICFVNPTRLQRPIYLVAKHLADRGHETTVLQPAGGVRRYPAWDNVRVIDVPSRYLPEVRLAVPEPGFAYRTLAGLVRGEGYELIHTQDYWNLTALAPLRVHRRYGVPVTLMNNTLVGLGWSYGKPLYDLAARLYTRTFGRRVLRGYGRLIFLYARALEEARALLGSRMPPAEIIPLGVDASRLARTDGAGVRREHGIREDERVLLFVGRLVVVKRVDLVIRLAGRLRAEGLPVRALIVGGGQYGNAATEARYRELARPLGDAVVFAGAKFGDELRRYFSAADALVLPSRSEGLPAVLLEAGACELPAVASDVGGVRDIVAHGETGYVVPPEDFEALVAAARDLLADPQRARAMGRAARERVLARFDLGRAMARYEALFTEVIAGGRREPPACDGR